MAGPALTPDSRRGLQTRRTPLLVALFVVAALTAGGCRVVPGAPRWSTGPVEEGPGSCTPADRHDQLAGRHLLRPDAAPNRAAGEPALGRVPGQRVLVGPDFARLVGLLRISRHAAAAAAGRVVAAAVTVEAVDGAALTRWLTTTRHAP